MCAVRRKAERKHTVRAIDERNWTELRISEVIRKHLSSPTDDTAECVNDAGILCSVLTIFQTLPFTMSRQAISQTKERRKKTQKLKKKGLIVATARGRRRMRGSVVGLGLLGLLTGAAAFSVSPALRPASTRASVNVKGLRLYILFFLRSFVRRCICLMNARPRAEMMKTRQRLSAAHFLCSC